MMKCIDEIPLKNQRVFLRVDFNVPLDFSGEQPKITDDTRIREVLPTLRYAWEQEAKIILGSHLGRPEGFDPKLSMAPIAERLQELLEQEVTLVDDCVGDGVEVYAKNLKPRQILLLENLRFHKGEESNSQEFAAQLMRLCDLYISDAFGTTHRKHASTYGLPQLMSTRGCGFLIRKEIQALGRLLDHPEKPFVLLLGGAKVKDKIKTIEYLLPKVSRILLGGKMAQAFQAKSIEESKEYDLAQRILKKAQSLDVDVVLPVDTNQGFDIGLKTIELFIEKLSSAKTIFWNGPMGKFEDPDFARGTEALAQNLAHLTSCFRVIGGGDSASAIQNMGLAENFDHISTGGGACLEYLEGESLPGLDILQDYSKPRGTPST